MYKLHIIQILLQGIVSVALHSIVSMLYYSNASMLSFLAMQALPRSMWILSLWGQGASGVFERWLQDMVRRLSGKQGSLTLCPFSVCPFCMFVSLV